MPPGVQAVLHTSGQALDLSTRVLMESRFRHDFSQVRVHTDAKAAESAEIVNARAYTVGRDVVFGAGQYAPGTSQGQWLLARELSRTVQQSHGGVEVTESPSFAREATESAHRIASGRSPGPLRHTARMGIAKQTKDEPSEAYYKNAFIANRAYSPDGPFRKLVPVGWPYDKKLIELWEAAKQQGALKNNVSGWDFKDIRTFVDLVRDYQMKVMGLPKGSAEHEASGAVNPRTAQSLLLVPITAPQTPVKAPDGRAIQPPVPGVQPDLAQRPMPGQSVPVGDTLGASRPLAEGLERIRRIPTRSTTVETEAREIAEALQGVNLRDRGNLEAVITTVASRFGTDSGPVLSAFLTNLEASLPPRQPSQADRERLHAVLAQMQVAPRGPWRQSGPGVLLPVVSQFSRPLVPTVEALGHALGGADALLAGLIEGLSGSLNAEQRERLVSRLLQSWAASAILPPVFLSLFTAGAGVGIVEDVVDTVKQIYQLITNFGEFVETIVTITRALISPAAAQFGHAIGLEMGRSYGAKIAAMAEGDIVRFTFELGRMIGPTIVYIVLAFIGVPAVAAAAVVERLLPILRPFLERFPRLLKIAEGLATRLRERSARTILGRAQESRRLTAAKAVDASIEGVLAKIRAKVRDSKITTYTYQAAFAENLTTEGAGLAEVINALGPNSDEFRKLYKIAYDGMNNRNIWESVLTDIEREVKNVGTSSYSHGEIKSKYTQAIWNISERRAQAQGSQIFVTPPANTPGYIFIHEGTPFGPRFFDVNIGRGHGMSAHMVQDLVVDRAFQQAGLSLDAEQFRGMMGRVHGRAPGGNADLKTLLWNALYDAEEGHFTSPDTVTPLLREVFGEMVD